MFSHDAWYRAYLRIFMGLVIAIAVVQSASAEELRTVHTESPQYTLRLNILQSLAESLQAGSQGQLDLRIALARTGAAPEQQWQQIVEGKIDLGIGRVDASAGRFPRTQLLSLPGLSQGPEHATQMLWRALDSHLQKEFQTVKLLGLWSTDHMVLITRYKPVHRLADLTGLSITAPNQLAAAALELWGAVPVSLPVEKTATALESGVVDGLLIRASLIKVYGLHEVGWHFTMGLPTILAAEYCVMNKERWNQLTLEQQTWLEQLSGYTWSLQIASQYFQAHAEGIQRVAESGKQIINMNGLDGLEFDRASRPLIADTVAALDRKGLSGTAILSALQDP